MNKSWVSHNLKEAMGQIQETLTALSTDEDYNYGDFSVEMSEVYHHLNTAWNSRDKSFEEIERSSDDDFYRWRAFPTDLYLAD